MKKVSVTFIVKSLRIVCPTESFIELWVFVLDSKIFTFYRVQMEKYFVALDPYSLFPGVLDMWEAGRPTLPSRFKVLSLDNYEKRVYMNKRSFIVYLTFLRVKSGLVVTTLSIGPLLNV
jgi:hypothetical protein